MRHRVAVVTVTLVVGALACRKRPEELVTPDASPPPSTSSVASADASPVSHDAAEADRGASPALRQFCDDAFTADQERQRASCTPAAFEVNQSMARAAAGVCAHDLAMAVARSRAGFDEEAGRKCVEMLKQTKLAQTAETDTFFQHFPCDRALLGMQAVDQPCRFSVECKDDLACVGYAVGKDGTCKKPPALGQACTLQPYGTLLNEAASALHHPACAAGAYCDGKTCLPRATATKACDRTEACAPGLSCVAGKCGHRAPAGGACTKATDCAFGLWCDHPGTSPGTCATKRNAGEDCPSPDSCKGRCDVPKGPGGHASPPGTPGKCVELCGSG